MIHHIWTQTAVKYNVANWTWGERELVQEIIAGGRWDETGAWMKKNPDKKKKAIRLLCKIENRHFDETKDYKDIDLTVKDVQLLARKVLGIELTLKVIS